MQRIVYGSPLVPFRQDPGLQQAIDALDGVIDRLEQTTDLFERTFLFRSLQAAAEALGGLRGRCTAPSDSFGAG
jgi:hypothetical protein